MRAFEFIIENTIDEMAGSIANGITLDLVDKGYKYVNSGVDKHVFLEPGTGYAFIVFGYRPGHNEGFSPDQKMFADWVRYCEQHSNNPHLPKFSGMESFRYQGKTYIQCRMERLQEYPTNMGRILHFIEDYAHAETAGVEHLSYEDVITDMIDDSDIPDTFEQVIQKLGGPESAAGLIETVQNVIVFGKQHGFSIDLHSGNYMQRPDGTIVVNDPYVYWLRS